MGVSSGDPYADWVKIRTCNHSGATSNCFNCGPSYISKMLVDGIEVTPSKLYDFGDADYHDVYLLFDDLSTLPESAFFLSNYTRTKIDIPASFVMFGGSALRGNGAANRVDVILRATTYPTFGVYNFLAWEKGNLWVPDSIYNTYITNAPVAVTKIHKLSDWTE